MTALKSRNKNHHRSHDLYDDVEKIKDALWGATFNVKDKTSELFSESLDSMKDSTSAVKDNFEKFTAEKPFKTTGIALLVGVAIGYLIHK